MAIHTTSKTIARLFPLADLSGLPTSNPGSGKPWNNSGFLSVGAASAPAADSAVVHIAGAETITGQKRYTGGMKWQSYGQAAASDTTFDGNNLTVNYSDLVLKNNWASVYLQGATGVEVRSGNGLRVKDSAGSAYAAIAAASLNNDVGTLSLTGYTGINIGQSAIYGAINLQSGYGINVKSDVGLAVKNTGGTADGPITASNVLASGYVGIANGWQFLSLGSNGSCIANSVGTPFAIFAGYGNTSHLTGNALSLGGTDGYHATHRINVGTAGTFKFFQSDGVTDAAITALSLESPAAALTLRGYNGVVNVRKETGGAAGNATAINLLNTDGSQILQVATNAGAGSLISAYGRLDITAGASSTSGVLQLSGGSTGALQHAIGGSVWQKLSSTGQTDFYGNVVLNAPSFSSLRNYLSCKNNGGYEEVAFSQGNLSGDGGVVSVKDGLVGGTGYFRMAYSQGYTKLETNQGSMTLSTATNILRIAGSYIDYSISGIYPLYMNSQYVGVFENTAPAGTLHVNGQQTTVPIAVFKQKALSTANALEIRDSSNVAQVYVDKNFNATFSGNVITDTLKFPANANTTKYITPTSNFGDYLKVGWSGARWYQIELTAANVWVQSNNGLQVRNDASSAYAPITASAATLSGGIGTGIGLFNTAAAGRADYFIRAGISGYSNSSLAIGETYDAVDYYHLTTFAKSLFLGGRSNVVSTAAVVILNDQAKTNALQVNGSIDLPSASNSTIKNSLGALILDGNADASYFSTKSVIIRTGDTARNSRFSNASLTFTYDGNTSNYQYDGNVGITNNKSGGQLIFRTSSGSVQFGDTVSSWSPVSMGQLTANGSVTVGSGYRLYPQTAAQMRHQVYDATLAAWQETMREEASPSGAMWGVFGKEAIQQTGGLMTAGAAYTANEQQMIQTLWNMARTFGFLD